MLPIDWPTPPGTGEDQMMVVETMGRPIAPSGCPCALRAPGQPEGACQRLRNAEYMGEQVQGVSANMALALEDIGWGIAEH